MDVVRLTNPTSPTRMEQGQIVNNLDSKMWVERFRDAGEFKFVASIDSGARDILPIGSFVTHMGTAEVMVVENHEINDDRGKETIITITGRGLETVLENRIVGSNHVSPYTGPLVEYALSADLIWNQIVTLINEHVATGHLVDAGNEIPYLIAYTAITDTGASFDRTFNRDTLYKHVMDLLNAANLGLKIVRPGVWSPLGVDSASTAIVVHKGVDRSANVVLSYDLDQIDSADYLWSNQKMKNAAVVTSNWVEILVVPADTGVNRRFIEVDATDIDSDYDIPPTGSNLSLVVAAMQQRGTEILNSQKNIVLTKAEVNREKIPFTYRKDFDVGDTVTVRGSYNTETHMLVSEYVEIEDKTGESGYPTLTVEDGS